MTERIEAIRQGYEQNRSPREIAEELGCSVNSVISTASQKGFTRSAKEAAKFRWQRRREDAETSTKETAQL